MCYFKALIFLIIILTLIILASIIIKNSKRRYTPVSLRIRFYVMNSNDKKSSLERGTAGDCDANAKLMCIELFT